MYTNNSEVKIHARPLVPFDARVQALEEKLASLSIDFDDLILVEIPKPGGDWTFTSRVNRTIHRHFRTETVRTARYRTTAGSCR